MESGPGELYVSKLPGAHWLGTTGLDAFLAASIAGTDPFLWVKDQVFLRHWLKYRCSGSGGGEAQYAQLTI